MVCIDIIGFTLAKSIVKLESMADGKPGRRPHWAMNKKSIEVARLLAEGESAYFAARKVGVDENTIVNWRKRPEFQAQYDQFYRAFVAASISHGIGNKGKRMAILNVLQEELEEIKRQRSEAHKDQTGGSSGLMVVKKRTYGGGEGSEPREIEEVLFDGAFFSQYRALLNQAAEEAGDLVNRTEISGPGGGPITVRGFDDIVTRVRESKKEIEDGDGDLDPETAGFLSVDPSGSEELSSERET